MIRFVVFDGGRRLTQMPLGGLHLFGQDEIPVRSQFDFTDGNLVGIRHGDTAVGLAVIMDVPEFGKIMLQTTRLPECPEPYNLNVEVARGCLMRISHKREEWGATELPLTEAGHKLLDDALESFIGALCNIDDAEKAAALGDKALSYALQAGEAMALTHAQTFLERRGQTQGLGRHSFGCVMDTSRIRDKKYLEILKDNFHFVTIPISWKHLEPVEQEQNYGLLDECVSWLNRNRITVKVGPLLSFTPAMIPDWLFVWENDFEQVREMAYEYVSRTVERYGRKVQAWDVISGLNGDNCFKFSFEQIIEMTRSATLAAKHAAPHSVVLVELTEPWGEYYAVNQQTVPPFIYADVLCQGGANFDGFGVKIRFGRGGGSMRTRDLLEISALLDRFSAFGKAVHVASVQVPSEREDAIGSCWHGPWTEQTQAEWLDSLYRIALSKPFVETVSWRDLADREGGVLLHGGLLKKDLSPKAAFGALGKLRQELLRSGPVNGK